MRPIPDGLSAGFTAALVIDPESIFRALASTNDFESEGDKNRRFLVTPNLVRLGDLRVNLANRLPRRPRSPSKFYPDCTCPCSGTFSACRVQDLFRKRLRPGRR